MGKDAEYAPQETGHELMARQQRIVMFLCNGMTLFSTRSPVRSHLPQPCPQFYHTVIPDLPHMAPFTN